ncbi:MAG TPA: type II 3-dehydroquinate dehydratase [Firmicutes bacterium]|jgi:3-dehydroquinate dehydratase-2|nr:type II 3-dehydroquinate dehydratase [Bacillota bacterium]
MKETIWVLNGPNLNLLGEREPEIYGRETLIDVENSLREHAERLGVNVVFFQKNGEGELVTLIHEARISSQGILINPGAYSHYSLAIYDALKAVAIPKVEVHISQVIQREDYRKNLLTAGACNGLIAGFGTLGYNLGLSALVQLIRGGK